MLDSLNNITSRINEIKSIGSSFKNTMKPEFVSKFEEQLQSSIQSDTASDKTGYHPFLKSVESSDIVKTEDIKVTDTSIKTTEKMDLINKNIKSAAAKYNLSEKLLRSVIAVESAFDPNAVSRVGAMGLMQLMPKTALDMGVVKPFDISDNIDGGAKYLRLLLDKYNGDVTKSLAAYNAGPARVDSVGGVPEIKETVDYVKKISGLLKIDTKEQE